MRIITIVHAEMLLSNQHTLKIILMIVITVKIVIIIIIGPDQTYVWKFSKNKHYRSRYCGYCRYHNKWGWSQDSIFGCSVNSWLPWLPYSTYQYLDFQLLLCSMTKLEAHDRENCHSGKVSICNTEMMMMMILYMQWFCQIDLSLSFCRYAALSQLSTTVTWSATQVLPLESQTTALIVDTIFFFATSSKSSALSTSTVSHSSTSDEKCCHYDQYCCYHD